MAAIDATRRYLQTVQRGDWAAAVGFFADDVYRLAGERSAEVWRPTSTRSTS
jgi:hypothetical protein